MTFATNPLPFSLRARWLGLALFCLMSAACAKDHGSVSPTAPQTNAPVAPEPSKDSSSPAQPLTAPTPQPTPPPAPGAPTPPAKPHKPGTKPKQNLGDPSVLDKTASGGQPGFVYLYGAFADSSQQSLNADYKVELQPGNGWRGPRPPLATGLLVKKTGTPDGTDALIAKVANAKNFANFGCDLDQHPEVRGLAQIGRPILSPNPSSSSSSAQPLERINAQVILICGTDSFQTAKATVLVAATIYLSHVDLHVSSETTRLLSITAGSLVVDSASQLTLKGEDAADTSIPGPTLAIAANHLSGPGRLLVDGQGASFVSKRKKNR